MPVTSRPPRPQSAHARTVKNDTYSSLAFTTVGEGSLTDSMEFTGSLTSAGDRTRPKSETPKLQRSRFPVDFSMSIDTFPSVLEIPTSTTIAGARFRMTQTMGGAGRFRRSRKSIPETPLSPETVRENYKTAKTLKALKSHDRKRFTRVASNKDMFAEIIKQEISEKINFINGKLKTAVRLHNAIKSPHNKDHDSRVEVDSELDSNGGKGVGKGGKAGNAGGKAKGRRPSSAPNGSKWGRRRVRPKSAPFKRREGGGKSFGTNKAVAEVERNIIIRRKQEEQRKVKLVMSGGNGSKKAARPSSAAPVMQRQETASASMRGVGTMRPKARPRSAAMARRAKDRTISTREKAEIVQQLLGSVAGNTLVSPLMSKDMKTEIFKMSSEKRVKKAKRFKKKRVEMEKKRIDDIYAKDWNLRMERLKAMKKSQQDKEMRVRHMLVAANLANSAKYFRLALYKAYAGKDLNKKKQESCEIITRQLRYYSYKCYRGKVRGAIKVLGAFFIIKIRLWKSRRDARCADMVTDFLRKLKKEVCLKLIVKGSRMKRWNRDIIMIQNGWRQKARNIRAQVDFIEKQLVRHQNGKVDEIVDEMYDDAVELLKPVNEEIERKNETRKLLKKPKRPLPKALPKHKSAMKAELLKEEDLLGEHFVPQEIRRGVIRYYLMQAKRLHSEKLIDWQHHYDRWEELMKIHERRGMMVNNFQPKPKRGGEESHSRGGEAVENTAVEALQELEDVKEDVEEDVEKEKTGKRGPRTMADLTHTRSKTMSFMKHHEHEDFEENGLPPALIEPKKPVFTALLSELGLLFLLDACQQYLSELRKHWDPNHQSHYRCEKTNHVVLREMPTFKELGFTVAERVDQSEKDEILIRNIGW